MLREKDNQDITRIVDFYNGKSIFITGAAGFIGTVVLEILLRCCPGIQSIYILLREKRGVSPEDRKGKLLSKTIFNQLRDENPEVFNKILVVPGDVSEPELGMSKEDIMKVTEHVSIVFHGAASLSFNKPLKFLIAHNVGGTNNIIGLCKSLKNCEALVFVSTVLSNTNRKALPIEERVYRLPYPAQRFLDELKNGNDNVLESLAAECRMSDWINTYAFTKCVAENLILEKSSPIPAFIFRVSVVYNTCKGSLPGYVEDNTVFTMLLRTVAAGILRVINCNPNIASHVIPVDMVANAMIVGAFCLATERFPSPLVANSAASGSFAQPLSETIKCCIVTGKKNLLPNSFRFANHVHLTRSETKRLFLNFFEHYIPAAGMDLMLILSGKKPRVVSMYRSIHRTLDVATPVLHHQFSFEIENFKALQSAGSDEDKKIFYTDLDNLKMQETMDVWPIGAPFYDWKLDKKSKEERLKFARWNHYFSLFTQLTAILLMSWLLIAIFSKV